MIRFVGENFTLYEGERSCKQLVMPSLREGVAVPITPCIYASSPRGLEIDVRIGDRETPLDSYEMEHPDLLVAFSVMQILQDLQVLPEGASYKAYEVLRLATNEEQRQYIREHHQHLVPILDAISLERLREIRRQLPPDLDKAVKYLANNSVRFAAKPIIELVSRKELELDFETIGKIALRAAIFP